jgi:hypothetical protein
MKSTSPCRNKSWRDPGLLFIASKLGFDSLFSAISNAGS